MSEDYSVLVKFLEPFTQGDPGYLGISIVDRDQDDPKANKKWGNFRNIYAECAAGEVNLPEEALAEDSELEWYFTPAVLDTDSRLQSNFSHSNVIWIDFDEPVDWQSFTPAPSIVVQTSDKKHHCYWLMREPIDDVNDQRYWNAKFLRHFDGGDLSGFDATQLLKLPWGKNLKLISKTADGEHFVPKIVKFNSELQYVESDFADMREPAAMLPDAVDLSELADIPDIGRRKWDGWARKLKVPNDTMAKLYLPTDGGEEKRSGALYSMECTLLDLFENNAEETFLVLYRSPYDKFTEDQGGGKGAVLLWKDINRVLAKRESEKANAGPTERIRKIQKNKSLDFSEKGNQINEIVFRELQNEGEFIQNATSYYYVSERSGYAKLFHVGVRSDAPFAGVVRRKFGLNAGTDKSVISGALHEAVALCQESPQLTFHDFAHYDVLGNKVYVDRYDGSMYVLDGKSVVHKPHGFDGVYFNPSDSEFPKPWEYKTGVKSGAFEALILDGPNYIVEGTGSSRRELRHLIKTWVASFFFPEAMDTKPIICIYGAADSGKTTLFQNLSIMFTGDSTFSVTEMPSDKKQFNNDVTNNAYIFYDNVEVNKKDLQEKLAQVATGFTLKQRKLYSTNETVSYKARCFVGITTRTLDKIQEDVAQRYLMVRVQPFSLGGGTKRQSMGNILREVADQRNELWSELLTYVNKIVKVIGQRGGLESSEVTIRMADYGAMLDLTCSIDGMAFDKLEGYIKRMQTEIMQVNDPLFGALIALATACDGDTGYLTATELHSLLGKTADRKYKTVYKTTNKLSRSMTTYLTNGSFGRAGLNVEKKSSGKNNKFRVIEPSLIPEADES